MPVIGVPKKGEIDFTLFLHKMTTNNGGKVVKPILESRIIGQSLKKVSITISARLGDPHPIFWPFHFIKGKTRACSTLSL